MNNSIDQQFVEFVVKSLVGNPDAVKVERRIDEKGVLLELTVDPEDLGRVIGKRGATAQSLRTLLRALGTKNEARYNLKIVDNGEPRPERPEGEEPAASEDKPKKSKKDDNDDKTDNTSDASNSTKPLDEDLDDDDLGLPDKADRESDVVSRTRKELEDLDDLDV
jgi:predicted RNA-binding protein YlqC (UPF0109 family)